MLVKETSAGPARLQPVAVASVVTFEEGLVGMPEARRFEFDAAEEIAPMLRMRSLDRPGLSFLVFDPGLAHAGYSPELPPERIAPITGAGAGSESLLLLVIATISPRLQDCTANLLAPLVVNPSTMKAVQVPLEPGSWSARHPLDRPVS